MQQRRADVDPALHPPGVLVHAVLLPVDQADQLQHLVHPRVEFRPVHPVHPPPEEQVLPPAQVLVQGDLLGDDSYQFADLLGLPGYGETSHPGVAAVGTEEAGEDGDGGRLAGPVGPQQAEDLALLDGEGDVVDRHRPLGRVELLAKAFDFDSLHLVLPEREGHCGCRRLRRRGPATSGGVEPPS